MHKYTAFFQKKRVLITGCCGTVGSELVHQLLHDYGVGNLIGLDNNESEIFFLDQKYMANDNAYFFLSDIRDEKTLIKALDGIDIVFHTAAYKHVGMCELSPMEAVQNNIIGVQNLINASLEAGVERVIFTSSDKAVNPTNVMGTSKLMGERLMTAANCVQFNRGPILASTRFGNVLGSRGSVIPIFREQIKRGGPVTLTHQAMTRFIMSISQAVQLVIDSAMHACGGEVFITKMPVIRIADLAEVMIRELAPRYGLSPKSIKVNEVGVKPGEKMYEELMTGEETRRALELRKFFTILPAFSGLYRNIHYSYDDLVSDNVVQAYTSETKTPLSQSELADFLHGNGLLDED